MNILICNERFLFRFGLDRVLILVGKAMKELGHTVYFMGARFDSEILSPIANKLIEVPECSDYYNIEEHTSLWIELNWDQLFEEDERPHIALIGGWPFFSSISKFESYGVQTIFNDCGAVPIEGFEGGALAVQEKLRKHRREKLRNCSQIIAISNFIANEQSRKDAGNVPIDTIHLGADHMEKSIWSVKASDINASKRGHSLKIVKNHINKGFKTILSLGRWEPGCYKNVEAAYKVMPQILNRESNCVLFVLAKVDNFEIPNEFKNIIIPIGYPDDEELLDIMNHVDLGLSFSLWEGFNLPLAEMQWLNKPVIVFNVGAHPEVVVHPWYLVESCEEMADKSIKVLQGKQNLDPDVYQKALIQFHDKFSWHQVIKQYMGIFIKLLVRSIRIVIDVTNASKDPANSGVIRVTRRLSRSLQDSIDPIFVVWNEEKNQYYLPSEIEYKQLSEYNGPKINKNKERQISLNEYVSNQMQKPTWILFTETINEVRAQNIRSYAKDNGYQMAAIFYDAIPILYPEFCNEEVKLNHHNYMIGLSEVDLVFPISAYSQSCLQQFWTSNQVTSTKVEINLLPGEFGGAERNTSKLPSINKEVKILCVSTLEPRKNHKSLIEACLLLQEYHPELNWSLTLVGNRYAGNDDIPKYIEEISKRNVKIQWLGVVDDKKLEQLYRESTFTVYPSIVEGYGMPIMESIWYGRPCICSNEGVMSELASDGGCLTTNIQNKQELYKTIYQLSTDRELLVKKVKEAFERKIKTWEEYTQQLLTEITKNTNRQRIKKMDSLSTSSTDNWQDLLYPNCLIDNWQMNHSERLGLTGLLSRINPQCSIEIGTYKGGSLSLISQYSQMVFSIDIDPSIPDKFSFFKNVSFFTGPSSEILPLLLNELDDAGIPVEFILIDGDHSAEGIKKDIACLHNYIPKKPMFVVLHDGFNPECRRGMLEAEWHKSPYVHWVDLDFIPGRIIEHGGGGDGEMWGGLGAAFFSPQRRDRELIINTSSQMMFETIRVHSLS